MREDRQRDSARVKILTVLARGNEVSVNLHRC